jgi:hypothetical protein
MMKAHFVLILILKIIISQDYKKSDTPVFLVNKVTAYQEEYPVVTGLTNGYFVIVWQGSTATTGTCPNCEFDVYAYVYDSSGKLINSLLVSEPSKSKSINPYVVADDNGGFVVAWEVTDQSSFDNVYIKRYDSNLYSGDIIKVNSNTVSSTRSANVSICLLASGNYVLFWTNDYMKNKTFYQIYDPGLKPIGSNLVAQDATGGSEQGGSAVALQGGGFILAWNTNKWTGVDTDISLKVYDKAGKAAGKEIIVNVNNKNGDQQYPRMAMLSTGNIVITWFDSYENGSDIFATIIKPDGSAIVDAFTVNSVIENVQNYPAVCAVAGGFAITWASQENNYSNIKLQIFDNNGNRIGGEKLVNTETSANMYRPSIAEIPLSNSLIVTWFSDGQVKKTDVWVQIFTKDASSCIDLSFYLGKQDTKLKLDLSSISNNTIVIKSLPTVGKLKDIADVELSVGAVYPKTNIYYTSNATARDSFSYTTDVKLTTQCTISLVPCYKSCLTCSIEGDDSKHNCNRCADGYYPLEDKTSQCYDSMSSVTGYTYDSQAGVFKNCGNACPKSKCEQGVYKEGVGCVSCESVSKISMDGQCVDSCPSGKVRIGNTCQDNSQTSGGQSCEPNPCLNGGKCSIVVNKVTCKCATSFIGSKCQYNPQTFNTTDLIGMNIISLRR